MHSHFFHSRFGNWRSRRFEPVFAYGGCGAGGGSRDSGADEARHGRRFAHRRFEEGDLVIYASRLRPVWIKLARTAVLEISRAVTTGLTRLALLERIKHWWRRPAAGAQAARPNA